MDRLDQIKCIVEDMEGDELDSLSRWVLSVRAGIIDDDELLDAMTERGCEPDCQLDHVDDMTHEDIARMAARIGMLEPDDDAVSRLADAVAEGRTRDALDMLKGQFGGPEPKTQLFLTDIRGRAIA